MDSRKSVFDPARSMQLPNDGSMGNFFPVKHKNKVGFFTEAFSDGKHQISLYWVDPSIMPRMANFKKIEFPTPDAAMTEFKKWETCYRRKQVESVKLLRAVKTLVETYQPDVKDIEDAYQPMIGYGRVAFDSDSALDISWYRRWIELDTSQINSAFAKVVKPNTQKVLQLLKDYEGGMLFLPQALGRAATGHLKRHHLKAVKSVIYFYEWDQSILNVRSFFTPQTPEEKAALYGASVKDVLTRLSKAMGPNEAAAMHTHGDLYKILKVVEDQTGKDFFKLSQKSSPKVELM